MAKVDDPTIPGVSEPAAPVAATASCALRVEGMDCASCAASIERALRALDGVEQVRVDVVGGRVTVRFAEGALPHGALAGAVRRAGYVVRYETVVRPGDAGAAAPDADGAARTPRLFGVERERLLLAALSGIFWAGSLAAQHLAGAPAAAALLALAAMVAGGRYIVPRGIRAVVNRALDMNFLMSIAAIGALVIGEYEEAASTMFLFAVAQLLEAHSMERARGAIRSLMKLSPAEATVLRGGEEVRIAAERVALGEVVVVRPGEKIPVDGVVLTGRSAVNQAPITGESVPVEKEPGADIFAGTLNGEGVLEVRSTRAAADTTLARIIHSVEEAQASRAPTQAFVDRFARIYTPAVVMAAMALVLLPPLLGFGGWGEWFYRALVLLVVACPCALVISTPVTIVSALAGAAKQGILIKGGLHLENAGRARVVAFDKTGTLTEGRPAVVGAAALNGADAGTVLLLAASAEARSEHPLARAICEYARAEGIATLPATEVRALPGRGLEARVGGRRLYVGSERLFRELGALDARAEELLRGFQAEGHTAVLVGWAEEEGAQGEGVLGAVALADRVRPGARVSLRSLRRSGVRHIVMLTGDDERTARAVAAGLEGAGAGIDEYRAGLLPDDKAAAVRTLRERYGPVLFIGDGINDAPALATADVGVAMGSAGTDVALETADVALMADDLEKLPTALRFARKADRIIRANIAFALLTKAAFVLLAATGQATLWMAVLADMGASLVVVLNGLRALRD